MLLPINSCVWRKFPSTLWQHPPLPLRLQASSETGNAPKLVFGRPFLSSTQSYPPEDLSEARLGRGDSAVNKYKETVAP